MVEKYILQFYSVLIANRPQTSTPALETDGVIAHTVREPY